MEFVALGSTDEIGASCHLVTANQTGLLLDAGQHPDRDGAAGLPDFSFVRNNSNRYIDHVLVSHAHHDHLGALPVVLQQFPHAIVHMTKATRDLADFLLKASARLQRRRLREGSTAQPLFAEEELDHYSYLYLAHDYEQPFAVDGVRGQGGVKASFHWAGHVLGAAGVLVEEEGGKKLFYTGDVNLRPQTIVPAAHLPPGPVDVLVLESTLGADAMPEQITRRAEEARFAQHIADVLDRGGSVLIPAFALGRAQETIALIARYRERGTIPADVPIYTAGSMRAIADYYDKSRLTTPRLDEEFTVFGVPQQRLPKSPSALVGLLREPSILVLASGMMFERTAANEVAQMMVDEEQHGIFLVGYAKDDSPAARLLAAAEQGKGTPVVLSATTGPQPVNCSVERFRFSGHSHRRDLLGLVGHFQPKDVILVHGEPEGRAWMQNNIQFFYPDVRVHLPEQGVPIQL